jgi:4'-phosphopantetheinyl transferase EntD
MPRVLRSFGHRVVQSPECCPRHAAPLPTTDRMSTAPAPRSDGPSTRRPPAGIDAVRGAASAPSGALRPAILVVSARLVRRVVAARGAGALLSEHERATLGELAVERRRWDWLAGRLAAKALIARLILAARGVRVPLRALEIDYDEDGAPRCRAAGDATAAGGCDLARDWAISIAHDDGYGACAAVRATAYGRVGVDLERDRPLRAASLRYFLSAAERRQLLASRDTAHPTPVALWAIKEAVVKAAPTLTGRSMQRVAVSWGGGVVCARVAARGGASLRVSAGYERWGGRLLAYATCAPARGD